jgi:hypothetical protein
MPIAQGVLDRETAADVDVVTRKAGLTPWHARMLRALERIAEYYDSALFDRVVPPIKGKRGSDA